MAKTVLEDKQQYYNKKTRPFQETIETILARERSVLEDIEKDNAKAGLKRIKLADEMQNLASNYIVLSGISQSVQKIRNEEALNEGRKALYKAVIYLEEVVSNYVDAAYSEYEERLEGIASVDVKQRYYLIRKLGFSIDLLKNAYGNNTKWKWSFVELEGRYATVAKNLCNLKNAVANTDPRSPDYEPMVRYLQLIKKLLNQSANRYREKYELSTNNIDDFKMGLNFLSALKRINNVLGDREELDEIKKKLDSWTAKLEKDTQSRKQREE